MIGYLYKSVLIPWKKLWIHSKENVTCFRKRFTLFFFFTLASFHLLLLSYAHVSHPSTAREPGLFNSWINSKPKAFFVFVFFFWPLKRSQSTLHSKSLMFNGFRKELLSKCIIEWYNGHYFCNKCFKLLTFEMLLLIAVNIFKISC